MSDTHQTPIELSNVIQRLLLLLFARLLESEIGLELCYLHFSEHTLNSRRSPPETEVFLSIYILCVEWRWYWWFLKEANVNNKPPSNGDQHNLTADLSLYIYIWSLHTNPLWMHDLYIFRHVSLMTSVAYMSQAINCTPNTWHTTGQYDVSTCTFKSRLIWCTPSAFMLIIVESTMWLQMECINEIMFLSSFYFICIFQQF